MFTVSRNPTPTVAMSSWGFFFYLKKVENRIEFQKDYDRINKEKRKNERIGERNARKENYISRLQA